jgi:quercetin dioxygenase-like cupin family protein
MAGTAVPSDRPGEVEVESVALQLSRELSVASARDGLAPVLSRVESALAAHPDQRQAWEPVDLGSLSFEAPAGVRSCWVFILRAGAKFGPERHPNSQQRTVVLSGAARFEILAGDSWSPRPVSATAGEPEAADAISIPPGTWHRIQVGPRNCICVSFHTIPAPELIEETPVGDDLSVTKQHLYRAQ